MSDDASTEPVLALSESAQATMITAALRAQPEETGGILVGVQVEGQPWATHAIELATSDRGQHHYQLPASATQRAVRAARRTDTRLGYLGDWHTHPADVGASTTDLTILALISGPRRRAPNPTIIVVRKTDAGYVIDAHRVVDQLPQDCRLRLTGDLPALPTGAGPSGRRHHPPKEREPKERNDH